MLSGVTFEKDVFSTYVRRDNNTYHQYLLEKHF